MAKNNGNGSRGTFPGRLERYLNAVRNVPYVGDVKPPTLHHHSMSQDYSVAPRYASPGGPVVGLVLSLVDKDGIYKFPVIVRDGRFEATKKGIEACLENCYR